MVGNLEENLLAIAWLYGCKKGTYVVLIFLDGDHERNVIEGDNPKSQIYICSLLVSPQNSKKLLGVRLHVLSGICETSRKNPSRSDVLTPFTATMKFVGTSWY